MLKKGITLDAVCHCAGAMSAKKYLCKAVFMKRYTTKEVAQTIGVGHQTLLRWLYAGKLAEPEHLILGGATLRLWTKADIKRARQYKSKGYDSRGAAERARGARRRVDSRW